MILRKEFVKLDVNKDIITKNLKNVELNTNIAIATLYMQVKDGLIVY